MFDDQIVGVVKVATVRGHRADLKLRRRRGPIGVEDAALHRHAGGVVRGVILDPDRNEAPIGQGGDDGRAFIEGGVALLHLDVRDDGKTGRAGGDGGVDDGKDGFVPADLIRGADIGDNDVPARKLCHGQVRGVGAVAVHRPGADAEFIGRRRTVGVEDAPLHIHRGQVVRQAIPGPDRENAAIRQHLHHRGAFADGDVVLLEFDVLGDVEARAIRRDAGVDDGKDRLILPHKTRGRAVADIADQHIAVVQQIDVQMVGIIPVRPVDGPTGQGELVARGKAVGREDPALQRHGGDVVAGPVIGPDVEDTPVRQFHHFGRRLIAAGGGVDLKRIIGDVIGQIGPVAHPTDAGQDQPVIARAPAEGVAPRAAIQRVIAAIARDAVIQPIRAIDAVTARIGPSAGDAVRARGAIDRPCGNRPVDRDGPGTERPGAAAIR